MASALIRSNLPEGRNTANPPITTSLAGKPASSVKNHLKATYRGAVRNDLKILA